LSSPHNPLSEAGRPAQADTDLSPSLPIPPVKPRPEDPVWNAWDVLLIAVLTIGAMFFFMLLVTFAARRFLYPGVPFLAVAQKPVLAVFSQLLAYLFVVALMVVLVKGQYGVPFWAAIRWNWPQQRWWRYLGLGLVLYLALQGVAHLLPIPKNLPIDRFLQNARQAYIFSVFAITLGPLVEELFFRGFLYPVLARRMGVAWGIFFTALGFSLIHAPQLGRAWGPVLAIFLVGAALTIVRAVTKSLAASLLVHIGYNGTLSALLFIATDKFQHLERLNR
jgi:hypothetical protein